MCYIYLIFFFVFTVNADDRESNMVFNVKSNEIEEDGENEELQVPPESTVSDSSDGVTASKPDKNFLSSINWHGEDARSPAKKGSIGDSDDEFENLRNKDHYTAAQSAAHTHDFFSEREGVGNNGDNNLDLFNLKSPSSDELNEDLFNFKSEGDPNVHLFHLDDDSDSDEPGSGKHSPNSSNNVDLLNLGSGQESHGVTTEPASRVALVDDMGVDLLNLSPGGSKDSQNVDLFSGTEKSPHRRMKRNKSADDVLSPGLHEDEEFFNQMGSRSSSSSRENVTSFTVTGVDSPTFDPFQTTRTKSPDHAEVKPTSPDLFDPFSEKPSNEFDLFAGNQAGSKAETFDPFGAKSADGSSSIETFQPFGSKGSGTNLHTFDPFGTNSSDTSKDLFGAGSSQVPNTTSQPQTRSNTDLFGDWGNSSAATLQPAKVPSPTPVRKPNSPAPQNKVKVTPSDPFSDFGNLRSSLPKASATATSTSPKPQKKPGPGTSAGPSWSRPAQQPSWQSGAKPNGSPKVQKKPNYTPSYTMSGSSGVFGNYGQKWSGKCNTYGNMQYIFHLLSNFTSWSTNNMHYNIVLFLLTA